MSFSLSLFDPIAEASALSADEKRLEVHTSDRILYRRCRRKWSLQSPLRRNLYPAGEGPANQHLWFGSGIHFALEDYHGHNVYGSPILAFHAYCYATRRQLPENFQELVITADGILTHYGYWAKQRDDMRTLWLLNEGSGQSEPQVEVNWHIPIYDEPAVFYSGTFDRIVLDPHDRYWILDYKTAQRFNTSKLEMDPQVSAYCWAFKEIFGVEAEGVVYIQLLKDSPHPPTELTDGTFSCNKAQNTTYSLYRAALIAKYGNVRGQIPRKNLEFAQWLRDQETSEGDKFIRRDLVRRNRRHIESEEYKIRAEVGEMLSRELPLYPNPTRDCAWDCDFKPVCVAMDDGSDYETILALGYTKKKELGEWRQNLPSPEELRQIRLGLPTASPKELELLFQPRQPLSTPLPPQPSQPDLALSPSSTPFVESDT